LTSQAEHIGTGASQKNFICVNCQHFKRGMPRDHDYCAHPQLVTVEIHNEVYGGVTRPRVTEARAKCRGLKFQPKKSWITRILQA